MPKLWAAFVLRRYSCLWSASIQSISCRNQHTCRKQHSISIDIYRHLRSEVNWDDVTRTELTYTVNCRKFPRGDSLYEVNQYILYDKTLQKTGIVTDIQQRNVEARIALVSSGDQRYPMTPALGSHPAKRYSVLQGLTPRLFLACSRSRSCCMPSTFSRIRKQRPSVTARLIASKENRREGKNPATMGIKKRGNEKK